MEEFLYITCYSIDDGLYQVVESTDDIRAYVVDLNGTFRQVGVGRVHKEGTPMDAQEFEAIVQQRRAKKPAKKAPHLRLVPKS